MRTCSIDPSEHRKWIILHGPIDPIENLNSVLDDNKMLTTSETIELNSSMNIMIEAEDLSNCTPATISSCSMIYMQDDVSATPASPMLDHPAEGPLQPLAAETPALPPGLRRVRILKISSRYKFSLCSCD